MHSELWSAYTRECTKQARKPNRREFEERKKRDIPFCDVLAGQLAPVLYFDFVSTMPGTYVLDHLEIETLSFHPFLGGGFVKEEAWYDVLLSRRHQLAVKSSPVQLQWKNCAGFSKIAAITP